MHAMSYIQTYFNDFYEILAFSIFNSYMEYDILNKEKLVVTLADVHVYTTYLAQVVRMQDNEYSEYNCAQSTTSWAVGAL